MKVLGKIEIALGLLIVALGWYFLLESLLAPELDRHGWLVIIGNFGVLVGGLLAFAGAMLAFTTRFPFVWHLPFILLLGTYIFGFGDAFL